MVRLKRNRGRQVINWPGSFETDQTHFALPPSAWGVRKTRPRQLQTLINEQAFIAVRKHAHAAPNVTVCGLLLGRFCRDDGHEFVVIEAALRASGAHSEPARVQVSHEGWLDMIDTMERGFPHLRIMGWYHTNPGRGILFSSTDQGTHRRVFFRKYHVGLIYDPATDECGIFCWTGSPPAEGLTLSGRCGLYLYRPTPAFYDLISAPTKREHPAAGPTVPPPDGPPLTSGLVTHDGTLWNYECRSPRRAATGETPVPPPRSVAHRKSVPASRAAAERPARPDAGGQQRTGGQATSGTQRRRDIETLPDCLGPGFEVRIPEDCEEECIVEVLLRREAAGPTGRPLKLAVLIPPDYPEEKPKFYFDPPISLPGLGGADGDVDVRRWWQNWRRRLEGTGGQATSDTRRERQRGETRLNPIAEIVRRIGRAVDPQLPKSGKAGEKGSQAGPPSPSQAEPVE